MRNPSAQKPGAGALSKHLPLEMAPIEAHINIPFRRASLVAAVSPACGSPGAFRGWTQEKDVHGR